MLANIVSDVKRLSRPGHKCNRIIKEASPQPNTKSVTKCQMSRGNFVGFSVKRKWAPTEEQATCNMSASQRTYFMTLLITNEPLLLHQIIFKLKCVVFHKYRHKSHRFRELASGLKGIDTPYFVWDTFIFVFTLMKVKMNCRLTMWILVNKPIK